MKLTAKQEEILSILETHASYDYDELPNDSVIFKVSKEDLIACLKGIKEGGYCEDEGHIMADRLLTNYIDDKEITELYDKIFKWYA